MCVMVTDSTSSENSGFLLLSQASRLSHTVLVCLVLTDWLKFDVITRLHHTHRVERCILLLSMECGCVCLTLCVCVCVCVHPSVCWTQATKMAELFEMLFWMGSRRGANAVGEAAVLRGHVPPHFKM